jgi:serine/threonine kinase PknH
MRLVRGGLILPAICAVVAACSSSNHTTSTTSTTSAPAPPVAQEALGALLLTPSEINVEMGATGMKVQGTYDSVDDHSALVANKDCLTMYGPGEPSAYAGSGANATHAQFLSDAVGNSPTKHSVFQTVVSFPTANQAAAFFTASSQRWPACSNLRYTITGIGAWDVGPVANTNGTLSATETSDTHTWACQRALTVSNNVAIDITGCGNNQVDGAVDITRWIAAKVTYHFVGPGY